MPVVAPFTRRVIDYSTSTSFQFEFRCERCSSGYMSQLQQSGTAIGGRVAQTAGGLLGGLVGHGAIIGSIGGDVAAIGRGPAHDAAFRRAVEEIRPYFAQCPRCGQWVCRQVCWNPQYNMCANCAPKMADEVIAAQAKAEAARIREQAMQQALRPQNGPQYPNPMMLPQQPSMPSNPAFPPGPQAPSMPSGNMPFTPSPRQGPPTTPTAPAPAGVACCPFCGAPNQTGKFCSECGKPLASAAPAPLMTRCPRCGAGVQAGSHFCMNCGQPMGS